jgi:hypothetical protein
MACCQMSSDTAARRARADEQEHLQGEGLFAPATPQPSGDDLFMIQPLSVLDRRAGAWQARKYQWMATGMKSTDGREPGLLLGTTGRTDRYGLQLHEYSGGISIFDPVLCEAVYRWFTRPGDRTLDPYCGGSVRGITAGALGRRYVGIDVRPEQVAANEAQAHLVGTGVSPTWMVGDATMLGEVLHPFSVFDLVFSCPPYADLEQYGGGDRDISGWTYDEFLAGHAKSIKDAVEYLRPNRYAAWVISDIRDKRTGGYKGLVHETINAFSEAGCWLLNDFVILDKVGTAAQRAERLFRANRKVVRLHQHLLVFVKGDMDAAAERLEQ